MSKPAVGIKPWGNAVKTVQYDDDLPRLEYMRLVQGINNVRIVTGLGTYYVARWKDAPKSKRQFGEKIRTSFPTYEDCPVKKYLGLEGKERYMVLVIDRADNVLKILDMASSTASDVETALEVKNQNRPADKKVTPRDFDLSIKFNPKSKKPNEFYSVVAHDTMPMSDDDLAIIEDIGGQDVLDKILNRQLLCPKPETVEKKMRELGWDGGVVTSVPVNKEEEVETKDGLEKPEDDDYSFNKTAE
jgi:hypothetical protein